MDDEEGDIEGIRVVTIMNIVEILKLQQISIVHHQYVVCFFLLAMVFTTTST